MKTAFGNSSVNLLVSLSNMNGIPKALKTPAFGCKSKMCHTVPSPSEQLTPSVFLC